MRSLIIVVLLLMTELVYPLEDIQCGINKFKDTIPRAFHVNYLHPMRYVIPKILAGSNRESIKRIYLIDTICNTVRIDNISTVRGAYVIDVFNTSDKKLYRIVTFRKRHLKKKIKVGQSYIIKYWPSSEIEIYPNLGVLFDIKLNNKIVRIPTASFTFNIYLTNDLDGLKYIGKHNNCE